MGARKYSASMETDLLDDVEQAAEAAGLTVSAWLAEAARDRIALLGLSQLVDEWELEHGAFTDAELAAAHQALDDPLTAQEVLAQDHRRRSA